MKTLKLLLLMVMLLTVVMLAGCQEGYTRQDNLTKNRKVVLEPTQTGFWYSKVTYTEADQGR
jgi:uncharacterized lipoprotein YajG